jgi:hypothetical protein
MITNLSSNAVNLITNAQHKAADAAHTIATLPVAKDEVGSSNFSSTDLLKPLLSLKETEIETSAAIKILKVDHKIKGSLFKAIA